MVLYYSFELADVGLVGTAVAVTVAVVLLAVAAAASAASAAAAGVDIVDNNTLAYTDNTLWALGKYEAIAVHGA
jgi:hypothetical protein